MITKDNVITYAYKGLVSLIYSLLRKKDKIKELYILEDTYIDNSINTNVSRLNKVDDELGDMQKINFKYKAKLKDGKIVRSSFDAYNIEQAKNFLISEGYEIITIEAPKKYDFNFVIGNPLKMSELSFALTQVSTYLKAGISLIDAFRILAKQSRDMAVRKAYELVVYDLLSGESLSDALERQPKIFPKLLTNMVKSAELTGDLPTILDNMADYYTAIDKTRKELKSAMTYPTIVLIMAIVVIIFVLTYIVPDYVEMFKAWSSDLPDITVMTIKFSDYLQENLLTLVVILILILGIYIYLFKAIKSFRLIMQTLYLKIPVVKNIIMYSEVSMFSKTFASLLNHGVFITDSMDVLLKVSDNEIYKRIIEKTVRNLNRGGKISEAFKDNPYIPIVAYEMIVTGESTGKLGDMMEKVADYYESLYRNATSQVKSLVEPILIVLLTVTVGLIIVSIIVPMFEMYSVIA